MEKVIPFHSKSDTDASNSVTAVKTAKTAPSRVALADLPQSWSDGVEQQMLLMQRLLGTNTVTPVITAFFNWCHDLGLADGVSYEAINDNADIDLGSRRHHSANYKMNLDGSELGLITLCRRERFSESELLCIEQALGTLARCLRSAIEFEALQAMVTQDPLTGLGNRRSLHQWIDRELSRTRRHNSPLSVMMIDLDHFKKLNDELGHLGGDRVLKAIAGVFKSSTRGSDLLF
ncbi:MAG: diguanylate cyclase, partial [Congregibacter sp.]|nr:diguanylate cyclase [Congregibacter sp.]